ncbi:MAG: hypothetical protein ACJZ64_04840 [Opitutales bacterium]|jgi:uncharacterized protein YbaR (Trm112 family)
MTEEKFPDLPDPAEYRRPRFLSPVAYWWIGTIFLIGITIVWLPSQCSTASLTVPENRENNMSTLPQADLTKELEFRKDGLWYKIDQGIPYSGAAVDFHDNGEMKSRTKMVDGKGIGLIEEWDENGSVKGTRFKNEFSE